MARPGAIATFVRSSMAVLWRLTLRSRMGVLVVAGVVPLLVFNLGTIYTDYRLDREHASGQALNLARSVALSVESELRSGIAALEVLATSRALAAGDIVIFRSEAEAVLARQSAATNILLLREDGQQLMNTALPPGAPLPKRERLENQRRVFATRLPSVSDVFVGVVVHRPIVSIDVPVLRADGSVGLILAMTPTLNAFASVLQRQKPDDGWIISIIDRAGVRIARVPIMANLIGEPAQPEVLQFWLAHREGILETTSPEGWPVLVAFGRLPEPAWGVAVGVETAQLTGAVWRSALISTAVGLALLAFGLWLAYWVSRSVSNPISVLRRLAAASDDAGSETMATVTGLPETEEVAEVLRDAMRRRSTEKARLESALTRCNQLLREVYHRVKNNLQIVDGLLAMQAGQLSDCEGKLALSALRGRVHALGLVHEQLMKSVDLETFDIAPFLHELSSNILSGSTDRAVDLYVDASPLIVTLDFAIPLALVVTELITNCLKHMSPDGDGRISVTLHPSKERGVVLTVSDNGLVPAVPIDQVSAEADYGTRMVRGLVGQLTGVMTEHHDNGFHTEIVFGKDLIDG